MFEPKAVNMNNLDPIAMAQAEYNFDKTTNFKEFFIKHDGIAKAGHETFISVFRRYKCEAGCEVCYIQDRWLDKSGNDYFGKYVPDSITDEKIAQLEHIFDYFHTVSTIDDLHLIKHKYPTLFEFYKYISPKINLTSMTDMAFIQQTPIALSDLNFASIYDITFSDIFLQKNSVLMAVINNLERLRERYPLVKIRFIVSSDPTVNKDNLVKLINWAKTHNIYTSGTLDNRGNWAFVTKVMDMFDHVESTYTVYNQEVHQIYTEVTHLMYDRWVVSFYQSTQDDDLSFYKLTDGIFKPDMWLECLLREKLRQYNISRNTIMRDDVNGKYYDYFVYITDNLTINSEWNFIPNIMFDVHSYQYRHKLLQNNFIETPLGILRKNTTDKIIPIYSFKGQ